MFGKKSGQRSRRPVRTAIIAFVIFVAMALALDAMSGTALMMPCIGRIMACGAVVAVLSCFAERSRTMRRVLTAIAVGLFVVFPLYIWIAGYDCEPPDDSDLAVQEEVDWGPEQEREFAAFTNVLVRIENLNNGYDDTKPEAKRWDRAYSFLT